MVKKEKLHSKNKVIVFDGDALNYKLHQLMWVWLPGISVSNNKVGFTNISDIR